MYFEINHLKIQFEHCYSPGLNFNLETKQKRLFILLKKKLTLVIIRKGYCLLDFSLLILNRMIIGKIFQIDQHAAVYRTRYCRYTSVYCLMKIKDSKLTLSLIFNSLLM